MTQMARPMRKPWRVVVLYSRSWLPRRTITSEISRPSLMWVGMFSRLSSQLKNQVLFSRCSLNMMCELSRNIPWPFPSSRDYFNVHVLTLPISGLLFIYFIFFCDHFLSSLLPYNNSVKVNELTLSICTSLVFCFNTHTETQVPLPCSLNKCP